MILAAAGQARQPAATQGNAHANSPSSPPQRQATTSAAAQPPRAASRNVRSTTCCGDANPDDPGANACRWASTSPLNQVRSPGKIDSKWATPILIFMALIVSGALIFTLTKLFEKIREGSSG